MTIHTLAIFMVAKILNSNKLKFISGWYRVLSAELQIQPYLNFYKGGIESNLVESKILLVQSPIGISTKINLEESPIGVSTARI